MDTLRGCTSLAIAAMSIFVASHLVSHPLNTDLVSGFVRIYRHETYNTYRLFYPERATVVDGEFLSLLREGPEPATTESQLPIAWPEPEVADEMWQSIAVELEANIQPRSVEHFRLIEVSRFIFHIMRPFWLGVVVGLRRRPIKTGSLRAPDEHSPTRLV